MHIPIYLEEIEKLLIRFSERIEKPYGAFLVLKMSITIARCVCLYAGLIQIHTNKRSCL